MNNLRLGVSKDILPYTTDQILEADRKLNKFAINTIQSGLEGLLIGTALSLFFAKNDPSSSILLDSEPVSTSSPPSTTITESPSIVKP